MWTGKAALERGLVDALGGVNRAVAIARQLAGIDDKEKVAITEMGSVKSSPLQLLSGAFMVSLAEWQFRVGRRQGEGGDYGDGECQVVTAAAAVRCVDGEGDGEGRSRSINNKVVITEMGSVKSSPAAAAVRCRGNVVAKWRWRKGRK